MKFILLLVFLFSVHLKANDEKPLKLINGYTCGSETDHEKKIAGQGALSYLYRINEIILNEKKLYIDLKAKFYICKDVRAEYNWVKTHPLKSWVASISRAFIKNKKWTTEGYKVHRKYINTEDPFIYQVLLDGAYLKSILTSQEYKEYSQGKSLTIYFKLDIYSKYHGKNSASFMILRLQFNKNGILSWEELL